MKTGNSKLSGLTLAVLLTMSTCLFSACAVGDVESVENERTTPAGCQSGKCDGFGDEIKQSPYIIDMDKANEIWPSSIPAATAEDLFSVLVILSEEVQLMAPTHLFGVPVNVIPYSNDDNVSDASGKHVPKGDEMIAEYFAPGEIGFAIKHHRPSHRKLEAVGDNPNQMKEHLKLQDTHIGIVVGVYRNGKPGAITINNPQSYDNGYFGSPSYPMIFVRPNYPEYLVQEHKAAFNDNIRTMMLGFNAVSNFPGDYNGGDPLAAHSPEKVREHTAMMIRAITGDQQAIQWFKDPAHMMYCSELATVATSAGLLVPLNEETVVPMVGRDTWDAFVSEIGRHNMGQGSAFTEMNDNPRVQMVEAAVAPDDLQPCPEYAPEHVRDELRRRIAFQPMTMADIVEQFLRTHIPRELVGEQTAPAQGAMLKAMKPGLYEAMAIDQLPNDDPRKMAADGLFDQIVEVVSTPHEDYQAFRSALEPLLEQARQMTGPRDDTGTGLFVPPSLLHVTAQGKMDGGLLGLEYVGHGVHYSAVRLAEDVDTDTDTDADDSDDDQPAQDSCQTSCDGASSDGSCWCDDQCSQQGDCCDDYEQYCANPEEPEEPEDDDPPASTNSCQERCGGASSDESCYCDDECSEYGDCCADYEQYCQ